MNKSTIMKQAWSEYKRLLNNSKFSKQCPVPVFANCLKKEWQKAKEKAARITLELTPLQKIEQDIFTLEMKDFFTDADRNRREELRRQKQMLLHEAA